jgi:amidase/aspartyl-tRNA(Asn)/glutamyl-tRNA(Gln) amidotransferase subunit A
MIQAGAGAMARAIARGEVSATECVGSALDAIESGDTAINAFTAVLRERALAEAQAVDAARVRGKRLLPLAGVPFAAKNLFDIAGITTLAGSKINRDLAPATRDAAAVARLSEAGAILVGATNMDEYAFGFTTRNTHYGATRNPHDLTRIAGGSSGGSAAAVAAGMVPLSLGTDTGGSVRVPAALCGLFGLKPTYGRISRRGVFPFSASMDHVGVFARNVEDLALAFDAMQGPDAEDAACNPRPADPIGERYSNGIDGLSFGRAGGYFEEHIGPETRAAVDAVAAALDIETQVDFPDTALARAAAFLLSPAEGAQLHQANLAARAADFDPVIRDRLLAGLFTPASWLMQVQRVRRWYRDRVVEVLRHCDVVIAGATPWPAFPIETETLDLAGTTMAAGPNTGMLTQPFSFIGVPVMVVPVHQPGALPVGVQLITAPWREDILFRTAAHLETLGVVSAPVAAPFA